MKYIVTHTLNADELEPHIAKIGGLKNVTIEIVHDRQELLREQANLQAAKMKAQASKPKLVRGPRKRGGSKVNDTVLAAMANGATSTAILKQALTDAGNAPGSLSTALAQLQKSGKVERVGQGHYQLRESASLAAE
jgi:predicted Rossmann fold nucleotide-binding protein DprA/Smf involved in DNA uptake